MPDRHASAVYQHRRSLVNRARNRRNLSKLRTQLKTVRALVASKDKDAASAQLKPTISLIDHSATKGVLHRNAASRLKSRLTKQINSL